MLNLIKLPVTVCLEESLLIHLSGFNYLEYDGCPKIKM